GRGAAFPAAWPFLARGGGATFPTESSGDSQPDGFSPRNAADDANQSANDLFAFGSPSTRAADCARAGALPPRSRAVRRRRAGLATATAGGNGWSLVSPFRSGLGVYS